MNTPTVQYRHIFFDLDHTLWDFERNSRETLRELYQHFSLSNLGIDSITDFISVYEHINDSLWERYRRHEIGKSTLREVRFRELLMHWKIDHVALAREMNDYYLTESPRKPHLIPGTIETLEHLAASRSLHIITNGFQEVQRVKLEVSGIRRYFSEVIISELVGYPKPNPRIFGHALAASGAQLAESIYIGDHPESDIQGSRDAGWDQVYFNPDRKAHELSPTFEIQSLTELKILIP